MDSVRPFLLLCPRQAISQIKEHFNVLHPPSECNGNSIILFIKRPGKYPRKSTRGTQDSLPKVEPAVCLDFVHDLNVMSFLDIASPSIRRVFSIPERLSRASQLNPRAPGCLLLFTEKTSVKTQKLAKIKDFPIKHSTYKRMRPIWILSDTRTSSQLKAHRSNPGFSSQKHFFHCWALR